MTTALVLATVSACDEGTTTAAEWGGMTVAGSFPSGASGVTSLAVGDFTRDGNADLLLVTRTPAPTVRILAAAGGGFGAARVVEGIGDPRRAVASDMDGDGAADVLAIGHFDNGFRFWRSSAGEQAAPSAFPLANHGRNLLVADLDGDSRRDLIAIHDGSGQPVTVTAYRGDGAGLLAKTWELRTGHFASQGACTGDFDGDQRTDLAVVTGDEAAPTIVFRGQGNGTFSAPQPLASLVSGGHDGAAELACADLNGDGRTDLVTAHTADSYYTGRDLLSVRLGSTEGLRDASITPLAEPRDLALADLNRDGRVDVVVTHAESGELAYRLGRGDGTFGAPVAVAGTGTPGRLVAADFNRDGWTDLAVDNDGSIVLVRNAGER